MSVPAYRPKSPCGYVADSGVHYIKDVTTDTQTFGTWAVNDSGYPFPGRGKLTPRAVHLQSTDANARNFTIDIGTSAALAAFQLGGTYTYGGVPCICTGLRGEATSI